MKKNTPSAILKTALLLALTMTVPACVVAPVPGPGPHDMPPPPLHPRLYSYWYYPDIEVYFDINRKLYFYLHEGHWLDVMVLPPHIRARLGPHVVLELGDDHPYVYHDTHRRKYPPRGKEWKKHKKHHRGWE